MSPWTTRNDSTPLAMAPRTSDSIARMFRSRVEQTTVGWTSGTSCVIRAANAYGETRTCLNGLSVMSTCFHRPRRSRWVMLGKRGGLTSTISVHSRPSASIGPTTHLLSGRDHVSKLALDLVPAARLQPAVGVHPQIGLVHEAAEVMEPLAHDRCARGMR